MASRRRALDVLLAVESGGFAAAQMRPGEEPFVRELALGVLRRQLTLDAVADAFGSRPAADLDPEVRAAVRIGIHQHLFLDGVPPHAIVAATVGAVASSPSGRRGGRGYVNALLRAVLRESRKLPEAEDRGGASPTKRLHRPGRTVTFFSRSVFPDPERDRVGWLSVVHSHPRLLVERWVARVGEEAAVARMEAGNVSPPLVLRPRLGRIDAAGLVERLAREGVAAELLPRDGSAPAASVPGATAPGATARGESARDAPAADALPAVLARPGALGTRAFREGLFSVQDADQQDAAEILDPRRGESVWDACAAPGGKAAQLAERLEAAGGGALVATDSRADRLDHLHESVARLGLRHAQVAVHDLLGEAPPPGRPESGFDAILLDAPCSNTAVLARRPEARWRLRADTFVRLAALQRRMIAAAQRHLAPGGRLVYSVCTHEPEEAEAHGLAATRSPFVWAAPAGRLAEIAAAWRADGMLDGAASAGGAASASGSAQAAAGAALAGPAADDTWLAPDGEGS